MPLPSPAARERVHLRSITVEGYKRADGLWDIEGHLTDSKDFDFTVSDGMRPKGTAIHEMWLRITVDDMLHIKDACASTESMPYRGYCDSITPEYKKLIGLAIRPGFSNHIKELFGREKGCTHITELIGNIATGAIQTMAGQNPHLRHPDKKPFQLDGCHALVLTGPAVAKFYPRWFRATSENEKV
jgi:hypothetical protein